MPSIPSTATLNLCLTICSSSYSPCIESFTSPCLLLWTSGLYSYVLTPFFPDFLNWIVLNVDPRLGHDHRTSVREYHQRTRAPYTTPHLFHCQLWTVLHLGRPVWQLISKTWVRVGSSKWGQSFGEEATCQRPIIPLRLSFLFLILISPQVWGRAQKSISHHI